MRLGRWTLINPRITFLSYSDIHSPQPTVPQSAKSLDTKRWHIEFWKGTSFIKIPADMGLRCSSWRSQPHAQHSRNALGCQAYEWISSKSCQICHILILLMHLSTGVRGMWEYWHDAVVTFGLISSPRSAVQCVVKLPAAQVTAGVWKSGSVRLELFPLLVPAWWECSWLWVCGSALGCGSGQLYWI